jgi:hypothetical protein
MVAMADQALDSGHGITGCIDVGGDCATDSPAGQKIRQFCCDTCNTQHPTPTTSLPPADDADPVHLYLLGGQSECVGAASVARLEDEGQDVYAHLIGEQEGVWLAGNVRGADESTFFIAPMQAGNEWTKFGPEISFGQRVREVTGARVLVVKYCWGGSSTKQHWNPKTDANSWDYTADDGTAAYLIENQHVDFADKDRLFVNQVYVARRATEALAEAGVAFEWKGIVWSQGQSDLAVSSGWAEFGANTANYFDAARKHAVRVWNLPIVDMGSAVRGSGPSHELRTGKAYAGQTVAGCNVAFIEHGGATSDPTSDCVSNPLATCDDIIISVDFFNYFGWDPNVPAEMKPAGANNQTFPWWVAYPNNQHSEYGGMILNGQMLADEYIRAFTTFTLPTEFVINDPALMFPYNKCAAGEYPSSDNVCWVKHGKQRPGP